MADPTAKPPRPSKGSGSRSRRRVAAGVLSFLFLLVLLSGLAPPSAATHEGINHEEYVEDFEDEAPPAAPSAPFYVYSQTGTGDLRTTNSVTRGAVAFKFEAPASQGPVAKFEFTPLGVNECGVSANLIGEIAWEFRMVTLPATSDFVVMGMVNDIAGGNTGSYRLKVVGTGVASLEVSTGGSTTAATITGLTITTGTWYHVKLSAGCIEGTGGSIQSSLYFVNEDKSTTVTRGCTDCDGGSPINRFQISETFSSAFEMRFDNFTVGGAPALPPPVIGASQTVSGLTGVIGFDVDPLGLTLIARTDTGAFVRTYAGGNLAVKAAEDTDCATGDMVFSIGTHVLYYTCTAGDEDKIRIRTDALVDSTSGFAEHCQTVQTEYDLDGFGHGDTAAELKQVEAFPITFTRISQDLAGDSQCAFAWAFSTISPTNEIGVAALSHDTPTNTERRNEAKAAFGGQIDQICTFTSQGKYYLGAAGQQTGANIREVTFTLENFGVGGAQQLVPALGPVLWSAPAGLTPTAGIACAGETVVVVDTSGEFGAFRWRTGATLFPTFDAGSTTSRGVALAGNERWAVVISATGPFVGSIIELASGNITGTITLDSGSALSGLRFTRDAQVIHAGTNTDLYRFVVTNVTEVSGGTVITPPAATSTAPLGNLGSGIGAGFGVGEFGGNLFIASIFIVGMALTGATGGGVVTRSGPGVVVLGIVGAIGGVLIAWGLGFLTDAAIFAVVALIILGVVLFASMRGGG